ncbi:hypothetical protein CAL7716_002830 [Calothrix sp. PCC 7716]|nr:hypothetical protein CAL7716_002830 [Calothrix sp. PCC 7716]
MLNTEVVISFSFSESLSIDAIGATVNNSPLSPLLAASQFVTAGVQSYQMHRGFTSVLGSLQTMQASLGVLH